MLKISWTQKVKNQEVLGTIHEVQYSSEKVQVDWACGMT